MKKTLETLFVQGKYLDLLEKSFDSGAGDRVLNEVSLIIGALVFSGRGQEAVDLFARYRSELTTEQVMESHFYLVINSTRLGDLATAESLLPSPTAGASFSETDRARFFRHQTRAFYFYYLGQRADAKIEARQALEAAVEWRSLWARVLSLDLLSHLGFQDGVIQQSLKSFEQCLEIAKRIGNENTAAALTINIALYRAQVAVPSAASLERLQTTLDETRVEDSYSRANILLELARQATLLGQFAKAESFLKDALTFIYQFGNAKQEVLLNFRWSTLAECQGEYERALSFISVSKAKLALVREEAVTLAVSGFEARLIAKMNFGEKFAAQKQTELAKLQSTQASHVDLRIQARHAGASFSTAPHARTGRRGEDPFGDWLDELERTEAPFDFILASGSLGFLKSRGLLNARGSGILVDRETRRVVMSDAVSIEVIEFGSKRRLFEIFELLLSGFHERGELFEKIWRSKYVPRLHDSVIYANLTNLRKLLGRFSAFLMTGEKGYSIDSGVTVKWLDESASRPDSSAQLNTSGSPARRDAPSVVLFRQAQLNERQSRLLRSMKPNDVIDTRTYSSLFKISTATATRDLRELHKLTKLKRLGRSRDVCYLLATS